MRIAFISRSRIPSFRANSIHVMKMCQAFAQEGHDIELLSLLDEEHSQAFGESLWNHYGISTPFSIVKIPGQGKVGRHLFSIRAAWSAKTSQVDFVYTLDFGVAAITSLLGFPTIIEIHDLPTSRMGMIYFKGMVVGSGCKLLVVITEGLKNLLYHKFGTYLSRKPILVAHDGVDLERFQDLPDPVTARKRLGFNPERFTVGYTGHLYAGRGMELIFGLAQRLRSMDFLMVGGEPEAVARYKQQAETQGLNNIRFLGFVSNSTLPLYQAACEVLLMPYQHRVAASGGGDTSQVMSPMKMFEYLASGRLLLASDLPVLREVLHDGNAVLCEPEDLHAWQKALARAINDGEWRDRLSRQARQEVEKYSWRNRVRLILQQAGSFQNNRR